jgi:hypothetical protein
MKWMTPDYDGNKKPSPHSIIHHVWQPSQTEVEACIAPGFGATISVLGGIEECGKPKNK